MSYPINRGFGYPQSPNPSTVEDLAEEMVRARKKFPSNRFLLAACMEELGELAGSLLAGDETVITRNEAKQTGCVAMRIYEEGDSAFVDTDSTFVYAKLVHQVGELSRALLQRNEQAKPICIGAIMRLAKQLNEHGDSMFDNVPDEAAIP